MAKRKIIEIDRGLCNGCGECTTACAEGALDLDAEGKAVLVRELYCDGIGACLDVCPTGALRIVERESEDYDAQAAYGRVLKTRGKEAAAKVHGIGGADAHAGAHGQPAAPAPARRTFSSCAGSTACEIPVAAESRAASDRTVSAASQLSQWPIQLHLVSPFAPYFQNSDLLVAADCTAFALGGFHQDLLKGKKLVIACPKLDETDHYVEKLAEIIRQNNLKSLTVAIMTVPCCAGLFRLVQRAVEVSGVDVPLRRVVIGIEGQVGQPAA
ncbi:MAG: 4Fe-4S dicluster domain-containing protein [Candidatus Aminicenantes bacterium]|nr:4Fe-4S dicluster domain-containing protein [Candidatus Aminicenantes bacterium]